MYAVVVKCYGYMVLVLVLYLLMLNTIYGHAINTPNIILSVLPTTSAVQPHVFSRALIACAGSLVVISHTSGHLAQDGG